MDSWFRGYEESEEWTFGPWALISVMRGNHCLAQTDAAIAAGNLSVGEYLESISLEARLKMFGKKTVLE